MKDCRFKKVFVGTGIHTAECPYTYPSCMRKIQDGYCYYYDKVQDLNIDARSVRVEWRAERGGKE